MSGQPSHTVRGISRKAAQFLRRQDKKSLRIINRHLDAIASSPMENKHLKMELLCNWRRPFGKNRIVYSVDPDARAIDIIAIGPRHSVYD